MPISNITNGESGSDTRTSLNQVIDKVNDIEAAADVTDAGNVGPAIGGATVITTLGDTDQIPVVQSNVLKSLAYSALKTLLGAIYQAKATILSTFAGLANSAGQLTNDGSGNLSWSSGGGGIGGSTGATDNAILVADGTGGGTLKASGTWLDATGRTFSNTGNFRFTPGGVDALLITASYTGMPSVGVGGVDYPHVRLTTPDAYVYPSNDQTLRLNTFDSYNGVRIELPALTSLGMPATDSARIGVKIVSGTAEVFVMDEAGNETQISPHNASAPAQLFDSPFDEIKTTCNYYTGIIWHKNTQRQLAGRPDAQVIETFEECLARLGADCDPMIAAGAWDWDTVQAGHVAKSVAARADWAVRKSEWEANPKNQDKPFPEEQPKLVVAKPMPKTLTDQLAGKVEFLAQREASGTTVSKTSMLLAMAERGFYDPNDHTTGLLAAIASMSDPAQKAAMQIYFTSETVVKRFNPVVLGLQAALGLDDAAVDALFVAAKVKDNEP